jgi:hypothetical protein
VYSSGGLYGFKKDNAADKTKGVMVYGGVEAYGHDKTSQETPNTQTSIVKYSDDTMIEFEVRGRYTYLESSLGIDVGNTFFGDDGYLELNGSTWKAFRRREKQPFATSKTENKQDGTEHWANFLDAIRSGKDETLNGDIHDGFYSSALPLLSNISYRLKRELQFMGADMDIERFMNDPEANALLSRVYRPPYVVPNEV